MKQLIKVQEVEQEGFFAFLNKKILIFASNYIYTGVLVGVNDTFVKLEGARLVYETGSFADKGYTDAQPLPEGEWYVQLSAVESFGASK